MAGTWASVGISDQISVIRRRRSAICDYEQWRGVQLGARWRTASRMRRQKAVLRCRPKTEKAAASRRTPRDGEMGTPVPRAGCAGFCEAPILAGIGEHGIDAQEFRADLTENLRPAGEMCAREP